MLGVVPNIALLMCEGIVRSHIIQRSALFLFNLQ